MTERLPTRCRGFAFDPFDSAGKTPYNMLYMQTRVVILAAGKGTRMKQDLPKPLTPVCGKPILQYLVEAVEGAGIGVGEPIVVVNKDRPALCEAFGKSCAYAVQEEQRGTAHAVASAREALVGAEAMITLYGDHPFVCADTVRRLAALHASAAGPLSMLTFTVPDFSGWRGAFEHWGRVLRDGAGNVVGVREFKDASEEERRILEINPSFFCFDVAWFFGNVHRVSDKNAQGEHYLTDMVAVAVSDGHRIKAASVDPQEAIGINTQEERRFAEELLQKRPFHA
ncbi:hypothetical protein EPO34_00285 [Patescibacteria group bacterium]|nr:MAG: hypothetical protein EPO34_00285 [Patescibacteria group bacterium]